MNFELFTWIFVIIQTHEKQLLLNGLFFGCYTDTEINSNTIMIGNLCNYNYVTVSSFCYFQSAIAQLSDS